jgi:hypothetical protein
LYPGNGEGIKHERGERKVDVSLDTILLVLSCDNSATMTSTTVVIALTNVGEEAKGKHEIMSNDLE